MGWPIKYGRNMVWRHLPLLVAMVAGLAVYLSGAGTGVERALHSARDTIRVHSASGKLVLVEIDAKSLRAIDDWPWPRNIHAKALRALEKAGASTVAFDVDVSSHSSPQQDARFAAAIEAARVPVILPTFRQYASQRAIHEVESLPLPAFRRHAQLAAVNIFPDSDGLVRSYPSAVITAGVPRPSIGAMLAGATGKAGQAFPIDTAIDPASIPHISYVDLLDGHVPAGSLAGKTALIGASAIELGDRYPVPGWGVISGPAIQLLAAETLMAGSSPVGHGPWLPLGITLALLLLASRYRGRKRAAILVAATIGILGLPLAMEMLHWGTVGVAPALVSIIVGSAWMGATDALASFNHIRGTDEISGLPNRRTLERDLESESAGSVVALRIGEYADLASLLGPARGAELVQRVADRLHACGIEAAYRVEENALAFAPPELANTDVEAFFAHIASILRPPAEVAARQVQIGCSFGRALVGEDGVGAAIDRALLAADQAREHGAVWEDHSREMEGSLDWKLSLVGELDAAMAAEDLWVAYQPKLNLRTKRIVAAEALVRWTHPQRGDIYPDSFIPQLEKNGRILDLTLYVLDRAMKQAQHWREQGAAINVAVNVSAPLLTKRGFVDAVRERLDDGRLSPELLTIEITESASMEDPERALEGMRRFADMGIRLSIDDYGTGQSTLSYLKHLPAREIKIDKSFVLTIEDSASDQAMVRSSIDLAHELGFDVVAEGVENAAILEMLRKMGCDYAQGWHIGRPVPARDFVKLIAQDAAA
ncbi:putative bifunctional diguanylate cyclase/phosphodiesterase [Stakelama marina]|uniref:EAL domain-containing protein n=1 Tax=Stakelama marina TaxID=2826939 RepID=A0A8T4IBF5_9SPHN|nr:EAL domain-containing protein [Stakelama marina]MBR0551753.1 EAL domain-containing protein [Stakelama marina]